ncbi:hypothetical protein D7U98_03875 [Stenotrophomonas maltophilia]|uniref:PsiF repeat-containing protein n=1 Tax=Stenotrophomonas bentonitica TaxID=1450134 RepID=A0ABU9JQ23_9GAMM|nr:MULTISPECIES: hypothetical protein [Stenotrophomonas]MBA0394545.1 hypothetical protein [Stenotrophomonas maltophilia]PKH69572.1 hypothetical protein CXF90_18705 [Stenotrophomonas sp. Betaine-02u-23]PKH74662.1 hypothetical protein CXF96_07575 [Stenotrophomonas sp. Betaine-02u-21]PKH95563.1 hypothetical protein CXG43_12750 [Stenotrophomonas sp. Bg11-02]QGL75365.1 hypothetical protein FEO95_06860 [Stenotrophomonas maltophilia]
MKIRISVVAALFAGAVLSNVASAHDPALHSAHAAPTGPKAKPTTCEELADRSKFKVDLGDAQTKALKERCEAQAAPKKK